MGSLEVARNKKQNQLEDVMPQLPQTCSSSRGGRCKRHPHQGLIGVCSICLKERLLALAIELEDDEAHADDEELAYLRVLDAAAAAPRNATSDFVNPRLSDPSSHRNLAQLQHYRNQFLALQSHNILQPSSRSHIHHHHLDKPPASHNFTSRKHKSVSSSPRHSSLAHSHQHALVLDRHAPFSPPFVHPVSANSQPQMLHWRKQPNAVSPLSLSGLNHFISAVKDQRVEEPKLKLKKKKSSSLWSLLQKQASSQEGEEGQMPKKASVQGSPTFSGGGFKGRRPDSSSMREVHASLCRGDASSLLSSPRGVGSGVHLPSCRQKLATNNQQQQGGHWRSSSTVDDLLAATEASEGDAASPSWISSIFNRKGRTRSKSISTACNSSPDLNAVMTASAAAKYGRFSVDAAAAPASSRFDDASKREARFRKKYASLFEETGNTTSAKKRDGVRPVSWALQDKEEERCLQCEADAEVQSRRMKLANFLASQANETIDGRVLTKRREDGLPLPLKASQPSVIMNPASPGRKAQSIEKACAPSEVLQNLRRSREANAPLSPGVYRVSSSRRSPHANALVYSGAHKVAAALPSVGSAAAHSSSLAKLGGSATTNEASPLGTQAASLSDVVTSIADGPESDIDVDKQSHVYPRSRSWSKNWNKAILSPILGFKGKAQHYSSRKRGASSSDHDRASAPALQHKSEEELGAARSSVEMGSEEKRAAAQHYSFLSKDYSAFSFYFSPLRRSRRKASVEAGSSGGAGSTGGNMSSARVNAADEAAGTTSGMHISSRHSVDGSSRPNTRAHHM